MYPKKAKRSGPVKRFSSGRICKKYKCKQRLSIYNSDEHCHAHRKEFLD